MLWVTVILCSFWHVQVAAFNLDTKNVLRKSGDPGSLFGFSVAFHQQHSPARRNLLLVGAPQAKHQNQVNVTGVVYQCDLTTTSERCEPIEFDHKEFLESRGIDGQWMGIRVTSQGPGKNVMMCAHRYQQWSAATSGAHLLTGQCYLLEDDLRAPVQQDKTRRRVVCDSEHTSNFRNNHHWFAYCQQGHGASFAKDGQSLLLGAPGAYEWKGIIRMEAIEDFPFPIDDPRETGNLDQFNPELIPLQGNSYLGFSTDSGLALIRKGELTVVSGAPRGGYSGQVAFLRPDPIAKRNLSVELVLSGPGLASSFGYDVAVVDLNGDGWEDLAVGAPQFYKKDESVGGAVYIYINNNGKNWEKIVPIQLLGNQSSMFGLAVENIGDINQDNYGDIAVGAPYEGSGRVYLYCGSSNGINIKAAQVLSPRSRSVTLFGYSLSGNLDVDNNLYPDLAVGSLSDTVFVYRARPVVHVSHTLQVMPEKMDIIKEQCDKRTCYFTARACFSYTAHPESFNPKLTLDYAFEADLRKRKTRLPPRVDFLGVPRGRLELLAQGREICTDTTLRLLRDFKDQLQSISVSVTMALGNSLQRTREHATPVLDLFQPQSSVSEIILMNRGCGSDNICQSNLDLQYRFCSRQMENGKSVFRSLSGEDGVAVITPTEEDIALEMRVTNRGGDDAHQTRSVITLPDTLHYSAVDTTVSEPKVDCTANHKGTLIDCELGNPIQRDAEVTFYVMLTTSGISLSTKAVNITLQLQTTSAQALKPIEAVAKVFFELKLQVYGLAKPSQVSFGKNPEHKRTINSAEDIGAPVQYEFRITNLGRSLKSFTNASLNIFWPKENSAGKWLLYLTQTSSKGVQSVTCSPVNEINPIKDIKGWQGLSRKRRQAEPEALTSGGLSFLPTNRKYKKLTCTDGLRCVEINCPLQGLDSTATVVLHSRLWNTTFTADYSSYNYLVIAVDAILSLTNSPDNTGLKSDKISTQVKLTVFMEREIEYFTKVAWWIILLTVIALLLLLAVTVFFLWMRGCIHWPLHNKKPQDEEPNPESLQTGLHEEIHFFN